MPYTIIGDVKTLSLKNTNATMGSTCIVLTLDNTVNIQSDIIINPGYIGGDTIITLPDNMCPSATILVPCLCYSAYVNGVAPTYLTIDSGGNISWHQTPNTQIVLKTHGLMFNIMDKYYNEAIGNNDSSDWSIPVGYR